MRPENDTWKVGILFFVLMVFCSDTQAWSGAGHMVIAAETWNEIPPAIRAKATEILKAHPDYSKWKASFDGEARGLDLDEFVFLRASVWPDEIRRHGSKYDHPHWHFVDYALRPPSFPLEAEPAPDDDILFGIEQCEKTLSGTNAPAEDRAACLSWLIHLIGDLHQPLHCASFFGEAYPHGDKGGNEFYVKPATRGLKLHSFWDGLLGTSAKVQPQINYAAQIQQTYPRRSLKELKSKTPRMWSLEGRTLAVEKAYLLGRLKGGVDEDTAPALPDGYTRTAKDIAERRAALAGYRLADTVRHLNLR